MLRTLAILISAGVFATASGPALSGSRADVPATAEGSPVVASAGPRSATTQPSAGAPNRTRRAPAASQPAAERGKARADGRSDGRPGRDGARPRIGDRLRGHAHDGAVEKLDAEKLQAVIQVASDINPKWASDLKAKFKENPAALRDMIMKSAPRLLALAAVRTENEELYKAKVTEIRLQMELRRAAEKLKQAKAKGDERIATALSEQITKMATNLVDISLKAQALELLEINRHLQTLQADLKSRTDQREALIAECIDRTLRCGPSDPTPSFDMRAVPVSNEPPASQPVANQPHEPADKPADAPAEIPSANTPQPSSPAP